MKANWLVCVFLLLGLVCSCNKHPANPDTTNKTVTQTPTFNSTKLPTLESLFEKTKTKAEKGEAGAQNDLGACYANGIVVTEDQRQAVEWYRKAAEQGLAEAQWNLGKCYAEGTGVTNDWVEAAKWIQKAAEQGLVSAQAVMGSLYRQGNEGGISRNYPKAAEWFRKAADQGDAVSQVELGELYFSGYGVSQDYAMAAGLMRQAAEQGDARGQYLLGFFCEEGDGVTKDYVEAYKWFNIASAQGNEKARQFLSALEQQMTPEQIAEAQQSARDFKPSKAPQAGSSISSDDVFASSPEATGTGFFITDDGYLISNYHVVKDATKVRLLTSAGLIDAKVVQVDAANDLALLKADGRFAPLPIAASRTVALGGTVATVGFPDIGLQGFAPKLAKGEIASLSGAADDPRYFQISVPVQPGNSGGALVDERGNVIGIVSAKLDASAALAASGALPENVNYAVKSSLLLSFLESVPGVEAKLKKPNTADEKFEDVVKSAQHAAVLVLVY